MRPPQSAGDRPAMPGGARRVDLAALALSGAAVWVLLWLFAHTDRSLAMRARQMALFFAAFAAFAAAAWVTWRLGAGLSRRAVWLIVVWGAILRVTLAPALPVTSSDIYRYLWEGRVIHAGCNPFRDAPNSPRLAHLRDRLWPLIGFKEVPAAYPPVAQYLFAFSDLLPTHRVITLKALFALCDIGTVLLLPGLLARFGRPSAWALLYAWHPLVAGEVVARGHLDSLGIFLFVLTLRLMLVRSRLGRALAGVSLGASLLAKGYAAMAAVFLALVARPRRLWFAAGLIGFVVAAYLPFAWAGLGLFRGISLYGRHWVGNSSVFRVLSIALRPATGSHARIAWHLCAAAFAAWLVFLLRRQSRAREESAVIESCFLSLAGFFLLSPVLFPWYLAWTVPFLCFRPRPVWLLFTGSIFGFYGHDFYHREVWWITTIEYAIPLLAGIGFAMARRRAARKEVRDDGK